jgi:hypothetical protein
MRVSFRGFPFPHQIRRYADDTQVIAQYNLTKLRAREIGAELKVAADALTHARSELNAFRRSVFDSLSGNGNVPPLSHNADSAPPPGPPPQYHEETSYALGPPPPGPRAASPSAWSNRMFFRDLFSGSAKNESVHWQTIHMQLPSRLGGKLERRLPRNNVPQILFHSVPCIPLDLCAYLSTLCCEPKHLMRARRRRRIFARRVGESGMNIVALVGIEGPEKSFGIQNVTEKE